MLELRGNPCVTTFQRLLCSLCFSAWLSAPGLVFAQGNGEVHLEVKDPSGAATEATGRLENLKTGADQIIPTDGQGRLEFKGLAPGRYRVHVSKAGFASQSIFVDLQSNTSVSRTITLAISAPAFQVDVVGTTPLAGVDHSLEEIPAPVQAATARDIEQSGALDLSDFLNRRFNGVYLNEVQGNPLQPDFNYRGYTASPLLGTPQGVSVYMDGVRLNQPFGDVVSWDLIPRIAIAETVLIPGSNPLFGLNTLGGAVSNQTKDGRSNPGLALGVSGGSFGRKVADVEYGDSNSKGLNWYLASNLFFEDGWRESSPSNVRQFFGNIGWQRSKTVLGLTVSYANNSLLGNGLQDQAFLQRDYASVYTKPDLTTNRSPFLNLRVRHSATDRITFSGNVYYRYIRTNTLNGDINEDSLDQAVYQPNAAERAALTAAGYTGFPIAGENAANTPFPSWRCIAQSLLRDEPAEKCNGLLNRSNTKQHNYGTSGQMSWFSAPGGTRNQFTAGAAYDHSKADFAQLSQLGYLNPDRSVTGVDSFADGVTGGNEDGVPFDTRVDLNGKITTGSVYATDTLTFGNDVNVVLAGRYNRTTIRNYDRIRPSAGSGSLTGEHVFDRFNPAVGITFKATGLLSLFGGYSEGSRAPTAIELGCADPDQPCKLPNAMAGDPPLEQVITRTFEAGVRGGLESNFRWNVAWFRADNRNDILFVASEQSGFGYFKNFGKTLRQGFEANINSRIWRINLGGGYTFLDATFRSEEEVNGTGNSTNEEAEDGIPGVEGAIEIQPGNRIPLVPGHMFKAYADIEVAPRFLVDLGLVALSSSYARGNENNLHSADGVYYLGPGKSLGYAVVNLSARYQVHHRVELFVQVNNLFDRRYYTAAQLGPTGFTGSGSFIARPFPAIDGEFPVQQTTFFAPGAPRGVWGGIRFRL
jgi:outer membrane receptor protein involved in Fe transport